MSFLLDTNIISELRKGSRCNPDVADWFDAVEDHEVYLSVLVIGEIRKGIELVRRNDHGDRNDQHSSPHTVRQSNPQA